MKADIHPANYRKVAFKDTASDAVFILGSTIDAKETIKVDGVEYPMTTIEISSVSHPFYTGLEKVMDTAGRVEKFKARQSKTVAKPVKEKKEQPAPKPKKEKVEKAEVKEAEEVEVMADAEPAVEVEVAPESSEESKEA